MSYPEEVKRVIHIAQSVAKEYYHTTFGPPHILQALLHNEIGLASWLGALGKDIVYMKGWAAIRLKAYPHGSTITQTPGPDDKAKAVFELAELVAMQLSRDVDATSLFAAILKPGVGFPPDHLTSLLVTQKEIMDAALGDEPMPKPVDKTEGSKGASSNGRGDGQGKQVALYKYCIDKTALAAEGKLDPIIGRDKELRMMLEVLGRRTKPNAIIVGEPGVGKTALVDGFARLLNEGRVPSIYKGAKLFELDTGALVAGASYKGEVEDRLKSILKELKQFKKAILFIDEIHMLLDPKGSIGAGAANLLKPELARGELTVIGATTNAEYRQFIESDEAFNRRFEAVRVEEPDAAAAVKMLEHVLPFYEKHHGLKIEKGTVKEAVTLVKRYLRDRRLPDSAVDLFDRTFASIRMMKDTSADELNAIKSQLAIILNDKIDDNTELVEKLRWLHREMKDKISPILTARLTNVPDNEEFQLAEPYGEYLRNSIEDLLKWTEENKESVTKDDITAIISFKTGIPAGKLQSDQQEKILRIEEELKKRVIGQDEAIKAVAAAIGRSRANLGDPRKPIGSVFLLGPTGTGKTELAKALAEFLFNDESFLIRLDMSEFKQEHSVELLTGAPPGYIGYEKGGMLVNKVREKPYAVLLIDEIEKAHRSVSDIFLQILDEGKLHDKLGKEADFSNIIVLFTSNLGSDFITDKFKRNEYPSKNDIIDSIMNHHFRPEYSQRVDEIVPFRPITEEMIVRIFDIQLKNILIEPLTKQNITLSITPEAKKHLALDGFTPEYGARQIKGVIRNQLLQPIAWKIISGELSAGSHIAIALKNGKELDWQVETAVAEPSLQS